MKRFTKQSFPLVSHKVAEWHKPYKKDGQDYCQHCSTMDKPVKYPCHILQLYINIEWNEAHARRKK